MNSALYCVTVYNFFFWVEITVYNIERHEVNNFFNGFVNLDQGYKSWNFLLKTKHLYIENAKAQMFVFQ